METTAINKVNTHPENFESILQDYKLSYKIYGNYLLVGNMPSKEDRIIYISVVQSQIPVFIEAIILFLADNNLSFRIVKNLNIAKWILAGVLGYDHIGKIAVVYIPDGSEFERTMMSLTSITRIYKGPAVPGYPHLGGNCYGENVLPVGSPLKSHVASKSLTFQQKYIVLSSIKEDVKGNVYKVLYFKGFMNLKRCIIKEGKKCMISDQAGRDMKDRLQWQQKIHNDLGGSINVPRIIDYFEENENSFLAMEYIKGETLEKRLNRIYDGKTWIELSEEQRIVLLDLLLRILAMVSFVHEKGYIHRDLSHVNFLLGPKDRLYLIDWELAFSMQSCYPEPAFKLGTEGFMSREQFSGDLPTVNEDIFALGALMVALFSNMPPSKLQGDQQVNIRRAMEYFTRDSRIGSIIVRCMAENPSERPKLQEIKRAINEVKFNPDINAESLSADGTILPGKSQISNLIRSAFEGLTIPEQLENNDLFVGRGLFDTRVGGRQTDTLTSGLSIPVAGILYLLHEAGHEQCSDSVREIFRDYSLQHMQQFFQKQKPLAPGLFFGVAGLGLLMHFGALDGMFQIDYSGIVFEEYFGTTANSFDLAEGVAGQALAVLMIWSGSRSDGMLGKIKYYTEVLVKSQSDNGSWPAQDKRGLLLGLNHGISGILLVLIKIDRLHPDPGTKSAIIKGLAWLSKKCSGNGIKLSKGNGKTNEERSLISGSAGIALLYLYAYEHLEKVEYLKHAEIILKRFSDYPVNFNYSLATGISGLGLVYLKAAILTKNPTWNKRLSKIYNVFSHTYYSPCPGRRCWYAGGLKEHDAGLLTGSSGILFFLTKLEKQYHLL